jgi:hypothetical protein
MLDLHFCLIRIRLSKSKDAYIFTNYEFVALPLSYLSKKDGIGFEPYAIYAL